jgi:EAL domain-containing protein (putative c-di-GMP-specific phosphodiesterase class I)
MIQQVYGADAQTIQRDAATLLCNAHAAIHDAKRLSHNCMQSFINLIKGDLGDQSELERLLKIESALPRAMTGGELALAWQPVVDGASGRTVCVEALLRWAPDELGAVSPAQFVPIAERSGLIGTMGDWVVEQACTQAALWRSSVAPELAVGVNVSPLQLNERFVRKIAQCLERSGLEPSALELEITEGMLLPDTPSVVSAMSAIAGFGVKFVIDDFGTGYSALGYLTRFAVHGLKIDRSLVAGLPNDRRSRAIVQGLVKIAHAIGLTVTAEGIETEEQAAFLRKCGADRLQGFLFSRPLAADIFVSKCQNGGRHTGLSGAP